MPGLRFLAHGPGAATRASPRSRWPMARTACVASPKRASTRGSRAAFRRPAFPPHRRSRRRSTPSSRAGSARPSARRHGRRACRLSSAPGSTSSAPRCAGATSSTSPRTRWSQVSSAAALVQGLQSPGRGRLGQALRGQQPGDRPAAGHRGRRRANAARDLPPGVRARGHRGVAVDGDVLLQQDQRHLRVAAPRGCSPRCCATSGASTGSWSPTGARSTIEWRRWRRGWISRCRPSSASTTRRSSPPCARASWTRPSSTRPWLGCCSSSTRATARDGPRTAFDVDAHHASPGGRGGRVRGAAEERRRAAAAAADAPARPSRSSASSPARRATRAPAARRSTRPGVDVALDELRAAAPDGVEVAFAAGLRHRHHRPGRRELAAEAVALAARAQRRRGLPRPAGRRRVRGLRPHPHRPAGQPDRAAGAARRRPTRDLVVVLANGSAVRLSDWEHARRRRSWSAGCPGRPPAARSPTCCSARPTRAGGSPRRCRCGSRTPRRT